MLDFINNIGGLAGVGILTAGLGFAYSQFKSGSNKAKDDLILTLKETAKAESEKAERLSTEKINLEKETQTKINDLSEKLGRLQGLYEASERSKKEYLEILQGRDPAQQKFMEYITSIAAASAKYMKDSSDVLRDIKDFMKKLNDGVEAGNQFNKQIEHDTAAGEGEMLRKKV